jgi:LacI family transcriptional regulator
MKQINISDLAKALNVAKSTVSKALRDSHNISTKTKDRVKAMAMEMDYQPNPHASSLKNHKSNTIALIVPDTTNHFFSTAIKAVQLVGYERGYHVLAYSTLDDAEKEKSIFSLLKNGRVDGVIMSTVNDAGHIDHIKEFAGKGYPVIFFDRVCEDFDGVKIITNDLEIASDATEFLINKGCKRVAFLSVLKDFSIGNNRLKGYMNALEKNKIPLDESLILNGSMDYENNHKLIREMLTGTNPPDGVLAPVEKMAITCYFVCKELKINIPKQLKVVSYSNLEYASLLSPGLTTITQPAFEMGTIAATMMFNSFEKKKYRLKNETIVIPSVFTERDSTVEI